MLCYDDNNMFCYDDNVMLRYNDNIVLRNDVYDLVYNLWTSIVEL